MKASQIPGVVARVTLTEVNLGTKGLHPIFTVPEKRRFVLAWVDIELRSSHADSPPTVALGTSKTLSLTTPKSLVGWTTQCHLARITPDIHYVVNAGVEFLLNILTPVPVQPGQECLARVHLVGTLSPGDE